MNGDNTPNDSSHDDVVVVAPAAATVAAATASSTSSSSLPSANKKSKTKSIFDNDDESSILSSDLLAKKDIILQNYKQSKPYPHSQIKNVFQSQFLLDLKEEIKINSKVNFKESDLFRVYQSIDLANLNLSKEEALLKMNLDITKLPNALKLRDILYSQEWRSYIELISGLQPGTLINKIDCACNCHTPGCHLLCHDDVIGTRKISYIIYLTEVDWDTNKEGGYLELYDKQEEEDEEEVEVEGTNTSTAQGIGISSTSSSTSTSTSTSTSSQPVPTSRIKPIFNSIAFFEVLPGRSYHAVQEVTGERPRLSLQGWYHSKELPIGIENATLSQLKTMNNKKSASSSDSKTSSSSSSTDAKDDTKIDETLFTEDDRTYLKEYIKNEYLTDQSMNEIRIKFENNSSVQFCNFLLDQYVPKIKSCWKSDDDNDDNDNTDDEEKKPSAVVAVAVSVAVAKDDDGDDNDNDDNDDSGDIMIDKHYMQGVTSEWKLRGPAHKQRYLRYEDNSDNDSKNGNSDNNNVSSDHSNTTTGRIMNTVKKQVFESEQFLRYLKAVTSLDYSTGIVGNEIRRFRPGLDYTVAHYGLLSNMDDPNSSGVLDATMCFVDDTTEDKKGYWECGDVGGFECYIEADIDDEEDDDAMNAAAAAAMNGAATANNNNMGGNQAADDEYNEDDDTELLSVSASNNTLSLVYRDPGTMRFVKYVGSSAPSSRYDICMEYELPPDNDDDVIEEEEGADDDVDEEDEEEVMMKESK